MNGGGSLCLWTVFFFFSFRSPIIIAIQILKYINKSNPSSPASLGKKISRIFYSKSSSHPLFFPPDFLYFKRGGTFLVNRAGRKFSLKLLFGVECFFNPNDCFPKNFKFVWDFWFSTTKLLHTWFVGGKPLFPSLFYSLFLPLFASGEQSRQVSLCFPLQNETIKKIV